MSDKIIGIDIGGTKTYIGLVQDSKVIEEIIFPTSANAPKEQIIKEIMLPAEAKYQSGKYKKKNLSI
jgi:glucokinase